MITLTQTQIGERIKKLRTAAGLSQEDVAKKLDLSRQSIGQIEAGERTVAVTELVSLAELLETSIGDIIHKDPQQKKPSVTRVTSPAFSPDKLRNLLLHVLARCGGKPNVGETVLYKLFYFIDFDSFEMYGKSVTGLTYKKMQFGPVPSTIQYNPVVEKMTKAGELKIVSQLYGDMYQKKYVAFVDPAADAFSATELRLIDSVIDRLSDMNGRKIADYVHHDVPWTDSDMHQPIEYGLVFKRTAPFARTDREVMLENAWQAAGGADSLKHLGPISKAEADYYENL